MFGEEVDAFKNAEAINIALRGITMKPTERISDFLLNKSEMSKIKNVHKILTTLDVYSTTLGGSTFVSSSILLPVVKSIRKLLQPDFDDPGYIADMKDIMLQDFRDRVASNLNFQFLSKATALDPRFKSLKVVEGRYERERIFEKLKKEMKDFKMNEGGPVESLTLKGIWSLLGRKGN